MDLQNILERKRYTKVLVNGTVYEIDARGVVRDVKKEDAEKLLKNSKVWRIYNEKQPVKRAQSEKAPEKPEPPPEDPEVSQEPEEAPAEAPEAPEEASEDSNEEDGEEPEEASGDEYPDPDMRMNKAKLQEIADAYEVEYSSSTTKLELVDLINEAMYPDGKE